MKKRFDIYKPLIRFGDSEIDWSLVKPGGAVLVDDLNCTITYSEPRIINLKQNATKNTAK